MSDMRKKNPLLVFDFDGVLAMPWYHPELPYDNVRELIRMVSKTHYICVASFNPRAKLAIDDWKQFYGYDAIRCGSNHHWSVVYSNKWRVEMTKSRQITAMLDELGLSEDHPVQFYDDDQENVDEVNKHQSRTAFKVDGEVGLCFDDIKHLLC